VQPLNWRDDAIHFSNSSSYLAFGQGRSYGDCCLNDGGTLLTSGRLDRLIDFDQVNGVLRAECGITLDQILTFIVPRGWFLPVTPGTRFVSLGGAIANDVHGKNHHQAGTFGRFVTCLELLRSDGKRITCSRSQNPGLFAATIGGLGLTGLITWAEFQLKPVAGTGIDMESVKFGSLDEFALISAESDEGYEYTVAWLDCVASGRAFGRGIFMRGNHSEASVPVPRTRGISVPFEMPRGLLNYYSVRAFNWAYYHKTRSRKSRRLVHYQPFFYPLDAIGDWNKIYGRKGFMQFQCVLPKEDGLHAVKELLRMVVVSGKASFLAVLKQFGSLTSPGILSFPRPGTTLCLDFPNQGQATSDLLHSLDSFVKENGGALYPAKDAVMPDDSFKQYFPRWKELLVQADPCFSSSFTRRVGLYSGE
jgi:FAD/FMN-containing dehydrogenase